MHRTENQAATDREHSAHFTNKYIGPQLEMIRQTSDNRSIATPIVKHPTNDYDIDASVPYPLLVAG